MEASGIADRLRELLSMQPILRDLRDLRETKNLEMSYYYHIFITILYRITYTTDTPILMGIM